MKAPSLVSLAAVIIVSCSVFSVFSVFDVFACDIRAQSTSDSAPKVLTPIQQWSGRSRDSGGKRHRPPGGFIADADSWQRLWQAWRDTETCPDVDFDRHLVLVGTVDGPNRVFLRASLDEKGDVRLLVAGTEIAGPGFGYAMMKVDRTGVKSVNGVPVARAAGEKPQTPQNGPPHYVKVAVKGKLASEVFAIGGETTGVQITAGNVTFELELGRNRDLRKRAKRLDGQTVVVTGELTLRRGVEIPQRWIVNVKTLREAKQLEQSGTGRREVYLNTDGTLRQPLVLRDAQGGFAGFTGWIWTIKPDGSWQRQSFLNEQVREADKSGKLSPEQLTALAAELAKQDLLKLPARIGGDPMVNPHIFTISFGEKQSQLVLGAGATLPDVDPRNPKLAAHNRFVILVQTVQTLLAGEDAEN